MFPFVFDQWGVLYRMTSTGVLDVTFTSVGIRRVNIKNNLEMRYNDVFATLTGPEIVFAAGKAEIDPFAPPPS